MLSLAAYCSESLYFQSFSLAFTPCLSLFFLCLLYVIFPSVSSSLSIFFSLSLFFLSNYLTSYLSFNLLKTLSFSFSFCISLYLFLLLYISISTSFFLSLSVSLPSDLRSLSIYLFFSALISFSISISLFS